MLWIRREVGVKEMQGCAKNEMKRFERASKGVERRVWKTFEDLAELWAVVEIVLSDK